MKGERYGWNPVYWSSSEYPVATRLEQFGPERLDLRSSTSLAAGSFISSH